MSAPKAAIRYANSLLQLAAELGVIGSVKTDMELVHKTVNDNRELQLMLDSPVIKPDTKIRVLRAIFEKSLSKMTMDFLTLVTSKGRESFLPHIAFAFEGAYNNAHGIIKADVVSAKPLSAAQRAAVNEALAGLAKSVQVAESVNPDLLGGLSLTVGDKRIDASARRKLHDLKTHINH